MRMTGCNDLPGWVARFQISLTELGICSSGACITTTTEPTMHDTHPSTPSFSSRSLSTKCANTELPNSRKNSMSSKEDHRTDICKWYVPACGMVWKFTSQLCLTLQVESRAQLAQICKQRSLRPPQAALVKINTRQIQLGVAKFKLRVNFMWSVWHTCGHSGPPQRLGEVSVSSTTCNAKQEWTR